MTGKFEILAVQVPNQGLTPVRMNTNTIQHFTATVVRVAVAVFRRRGRDVGRDCAEASPPHGIGCGFDRIEAVAFAPPVEDTHAIPMFNP